MEALLVTPGPYGHPWIPGAHCWLIGFPSIEWGFLEGENFTRAICAGVKALGGALVIVGHRREL